MPKVPLYGTGLGGIVKDIPAHLLPPEVWSDGNNMKMQDQHAVRAFGYQQVFGTPSVAPGFVFFVPTATADSFWLYADLVAVYAWNGLTHTDITRAAGAYTAVNYRDWNGCILGGVPILNNGADIPQYWPTLAIGTDLANLTNWPATLRAKVIRNFGRFLVALNLNDNGTLLPHALRWSSQADPGSVPASWDPADATVDTGGTHLTDIKGGNIVDGYLLGNALIIYKQRAAHMMRFVGGNDIMGFELLFENGLLAPRCCALFDAGTRHFCVGETGIYHHSGTKSVEYPLEMKDQAYFFSDLDPTNYLNTHVFENPASKEVWIAYPSAGATYPNKAMVWNYKTNVVYFKDFLGVSVDHGTVTESLSDTWDGDSGSWDADPTVWDPQSARRLIAGDPTNTKLWALELGLAYGTQVTTSFVQRLAWAFVGKDRQGNPKADYSSRRLVKRIWPKVRGAATVRLRVGFQEVIDGAVTWQEYKTVNPAVPFVDVYATGRLPAIEYTSQGDLSWQIEGHDVEVEVLSEL